MNDTEPRPEPEALLAEAAKEGRGRLKVFLGAAPGVGKTYAMLEAAQRRAAEGVDVVAAVVETHGRAETDALLRGIEVLPRRPHLYRGRILHEMDLDALLARRPQLALIDELAHSNVGENRHDKRWQDVEEVLAAGIDVMTTLNVQHLETLNDTVARISGVRVRETVPDKALELADEIELIDLPPEELIERLRQGRVYVADQVARAIQNFFSKGNLTALRELAMRVAADRVDAQLIAHMRRSAIAGPWPTQERILVCVNEAPVAKTLVRAAKRTADRARAGWIALNVVSAATETFGDADKDRRAEALRLAEALGAEIATLNAEGDVAGEILAFARARNVSRLIVGRPRRRGWLARLGRESVAETLIRRAEDFEVMVVSPETPAERRATLAAPAPRLERDPRAYALATAITAAAALAAWTVDTVLPVASLSLIFLTGVIVTATRAGLWPALWAATLSFLLYNFFFTDPRFTFHMARQDDVLTLVLFYAASVLPGNLAGQLRQRADAQRAIAERTNALYDFSRKAASAATFDDVVWAAVSHVSATLKCDSILLAPDADARLAIAGGFPPEDTLDVRDRSAADWAWERGEEAGRGSATLPSSRWLFLPVGTARGRLAVLGIAYADDRAFSPADRRLLDLLVDQVAVALERTRLAADVEQSRVVSETERLRSALLSSVSHDLRTPLVSIIGAASSLLDAETELSSAQRRELAATIREEGERLNRYIQNLLDMTRLGYGALELRRRPTDVAELVGAARRQLGAALRGHDVAVDFPQDLPPLDVDPVLIEQVLINLLDNAAKYAPQGSRIAVAGREEGARLRLSVSDEGPGIPPRARARIFDMFYRVEAGDVQRAGAGLGLAICKGIVDAHGGEIRALAARADGSGTRIEIVLPAAGAEAPARWRAR
jgi:two-component system sensor histidine kinase KdpD